MSTRAGKTPRRRRIGRPRRGGPAAGQVPGSGVSLRFLRDGSGGQSRKVISFHPGFGGGDDVDAAAGEDLESEVAAAFGPFVGLFGQHRADEADDGGACGEDAYGGGAASDRAVEAFGGVVGPDLGPHVLGELMEGEDVDAGGVEVVVDLGSLPST